MRPGRDDVAGGEPARRAVALAALRSSLAETVRVCAGLTTADRTRPTPCPELDVGALLAHLVGWQRVFAACAGDQPPPFDGESPTVALDATDPVGQLRRSADQLLEALRSRAADTVTVPYRGVVPVRDLVAEQVAETVLHTWDLARALDRPITFTADVLDVADRGLTGLLGASFAAAAFAGASERTGERTADADDQLDPAGRLERLVRRSGRS